MPRILIVAYGNPLRSDDSLAWRAADALERRFPRDAVEILRLHQLAPEVADSLRERELVLFIDAARTDNVENRRPGEIHVREVSGAKTGGSPGQFSHVYSPAKVLDLARELYNATPKAYVITVAGEHFEHGECLSAPVINAIPELLAKIEQLVKAAAETPQTTKERK